MEPPQKILKLSSIPSTSSMEQEITEKDLPLLANVDDVRVHHYIFNFKMNFPQKVVTSVMILFLEWSETDKGLPKSEKLVLDACYLKIKEVYSLKTEKCYLVPEQFANYDKLGNRKNFYRNGQNWLELDAFQEKLNFSVEKWSIVISGWNDPPSVIRMEYETLPNSPSLDWRPIGTSIYDGKDVRSTCVYTPAMPVNNRGLFPCQEPPSALATWEAIMEVENGMIPLLTSDEPGKIIGNDKDTTTFYFCTSIPLPMSTFALVVGHYAMQIELKQSRAGGNETEKAETETDPAYSFACEKHLVYPCRFGNLKAIQEKFLPVRLFSFEKISGDILNIEKFSNFVNVSLKACYEIFGPHPFHRLDLVIMPPCYPHMGLASPSMVFLSPSNFSGSDENEPLYVCRIPHEICHSWFGLLIGALDWTEEWLSEGFSTYCEDLIFEETYHNFFPRKSKEEIQKEQRLKVCLRFVTLKNELQNTDNELHVLSRESEDNQKAKNGLEPIKQFMHVHYYKGYFFLWHLAYFVGQEKFVRFLKEYIWRYHAQLVSSDIFLQCYYDKFENELKSNPKFVCVKKLKQEWLEVNKLPEPFDALDLLESSELNTTLEEDYISIPSLSCGKMFAAEMKSICFSSKSEEPFRKTIERLTTTELIFLLELVIRFMHSNEKIGKSMYDKLIQSSVFKIDTQNPEVVHRWCELIILNKDKRRLNAVEVFLERHMAMGVYLYGELMISEKLSFQKLAKRVYRKLEGLYDLGTKRVLSEMLF